MQSKAKQLIEKFRDMETIRSPYEKRWKDIYKYVLQKPDNFLSNSMGGKEAEPDIFNSVVTEAWANLTSSLHSGLTNISSKWAQLEGTIELEQKESREWLQKATGKILSALNNPCYGFPVSNFIALQMQTSIGTSCTFIEETNDPNEVFSCIDIPIFEVYIDTDYKGKVDTVARKFKLTARQAIQKWGDLIQEGEITKANKTSPNQKFEFVHLVSPKSDYLSNIDLPFESNYIDLSSNKIIETKGYYEMPYIIGIFDTIPGELYGVGRSHHVMPEVHMVNRIEQSGLITMQLQAMAPLLGREDLELSQEFQLSPGIYIPGGIDDNGQDALRTMQVGGAINTLLISIERAEERIRRAFFYDKLLSADSPTKTATEALQIRDERLRNISPYVQKIQLYLNDVIERVFGIMMRKGLLGRLPDEVIQKGGLIQGRDYEVRYLSPMANLANLEESQSILKSIGLQGPLLQARPEGLDWYNIDAITPYAMRNSGLQERLINSEAQVAEIRNARNKQQQVQQALAMAQAAPNLATPTPTQKQ